MIGGDSRLGDPLGLRSIVAARSRRISLTDGLVFPAGPLEAWNEAIFAFHGGSFSVRV